MIVDSGVLDIRAKTDTNTSAGRYTLNDFFGTGLGRIMNFIFEVRILYDTIEARFVIFAQERNGGGGVPSTGPAQQNILLAVTKSSDPIADGWNFQSINALIPYAVGALPPHVSLLRWYPQQIVQSYVCIMSASAASVSCL